MERMVVEVHVGRFASGDYFTASGYSLGQYWWSYLSWTSYIRAKLSARLPRGQLLILFTLANRPSNC